MSLVRVKFVSKKISKVRWKPQSNTVFVTGSWDDSINSICLWSNPAGSTMLKDSLDNLDNLEPHVVAQVDFPGNVTDLKVLLSDIIFASSSNGSLYIYRFTDQSLSFFSKLDKVHSFKNCPAAVTGITIKGSEVTSVGEDGCICIYNFQKMQSVRKIATSDQCSFSVVSYLRHQEIAAGNALGYLKVFDLRANSDKPSQTLTPPGDQMGLMSIAVHPTQPHVFATGHDNGSVCIWDLRQDSNPTSTFLYHSAAVTDLLFHPTNPNFLYTSCMGGTVLQWNAADTKSILMGDDEFSQPVISGNPWLNCDISPKKLDVTSLSSGNGVCVNSLDISSSTLLWGAENEALYILPDILV